VKGFAAALAAFAALSASDLSFAPLATHRYVRTGTTAPEGRIPQAPETGPQLFWIRSEAGFAKFGYVKAEAPSTGLDAAHGGPGHAGAPGDPDFAKQDVILLTLGVKRTAGFSISLEAVKKSGREIRFLARSHSPAPDAVVAEALTQPSVLVVVEKLPRDSRPVLVLDGQDAKSDLRVLE
jgi:hypothetical protein